MKTQTKAQTRKSKSHLISLCPPVTPTEDAPKDAITLFKFDCPEDQALHVLDILQVLDRMFSYSEHLEGEDFEAAAGLILHVRDCLKPLLKEFTGDLEARRARA